MPRRIKIVCVLLAFVVCCCFIPLFNSAPSIHATSGLNVGETDLEVNQGILSGEPAVVYDSTEGLYKMWYTSGPESYTALDDFLDALLAEVSTYLK